MGANWIDSTMRMVFSMIDKIIYGLISDIYVIIVKLADIRIFGDDTLGEFSSRVYGLIAIFMAFKLIFTFVNYAVNPDALTDKKTGGTKLITNIMVSLVLLIAVPGIIFPLSRDIQSAILTENIIPAIILGTDSSTIGEGDSQEDYNLRMGRMLSYNVMRSFFVINSDICPDTNFVENEGGSYGGADAEADPTKLSNLYWQLEPDCKTKLTSAIDSSYGDTNKVVNNFERSYNQYSVKILLGGTDEYDLKLLKTNSDEYVFEYKYFLSTIAGGFVAWMLICICFQVAIRTIKLAFLELIAPIPILSYIDEKSKAKSFNGWVKTCVSTYLDLFIRLAAIFFASFVISKISKNLTFEHMDGTPGPLIYTIIIIGALMFVEQLPKLIQDIFGISGGGGFSLNPFKGSKLASKVTKGALVGGAALGVGTALGAAANIRGANARNRELHERLQNETDPEQRRKLESQLINKTRAGLSAIAGAGSAGFRSAVRGSKTGKFASSVSGGVSTSSAYREQRIAKNGFVQRQKAKMDDMMNVPSQDDGEYSVLKSDLKRMKRDQADLQSMETAVEKARMDMYTKNPALDTMLDAKTKKLNAKYTNPENDIAKAYQEYVNDQKSMTESEFKEDFNRRMAAQAAATRAAGGTGTTGGVGTASGAGTAQGSAQQGPETSGPRMNTEENAASRMNTANGADDNVVNFENYRRSTANAEATSTYEQSTSTTQDISREPSSTSTVETSRTDNVAAAELAWQEYKAAGKPKNIPLSEADFTAFYKATMNKENLNTLTNQKANEITALENRIDNSKKVGGK